MKRFIFMALTMIFLFSACAHKNCCGHCTHDQAAAKVTTARD